MNGRPAKVAAAGKNANIQHLLEVQVEVIGVRRARVLGNVGNLPRAAVVQPRGFVAELHERVFERPAL